MGAARSRRKRPLNSQKEMEKAIAFVKAHDSGKGHLPYNNDRLLKEAPFCRELTKELNSLLSSRQNSIAVLDKGAGKGRMLLEVKRISPKRIDATAITLTKTINAKDSRRVGRVMIGAGLQARHSKKYALMYDCFGEDYFLPKQAVKKSILKSICLLENGGSLFTILPIAYADNRSILTKAEARDLISDLKKSTPGIKVFANFMARRFDRREYLDLVLQIKKT